MASIMKGLKNRGLKTPKKETHHSGAAAVGHRPMGDSPRKGTAKGPKSMGPRRG